MSVAASSSTGSLQACNHCGQIHRDGNLDGETTLYCARCHQRLPRDRRLPWTRNPALAFALASLILYFPAILLPILQIEQFGLRATNSLLGGTLELLRQGNWFVGFVVLLFSIVLPMLKIVSVLELTIARQLQQRHQLWLLRLIELSGRWGMLDVLLLALLVMIVKLGELVHFEILSGVFAFAGCVLCNLLATANFHPYQIWDGSQAIE